MAISHGQTHRRAVLQDREYERPEASLDYINITCQDFRNIPSLCAAEAAIDRICLSNVNLLSKITPSILSSRTTLSTSPPKARAGKRWRSVKERDIINALVLLALTSMPHCLHQPSIRERSRFIDAITRGLSRGEGTTATPSRISAYVTKLFSTISVNLAVYNKNNNGPRTLPCGTPDTTGMLRLGTPSTTTFWKRPLRNWLMVPRTIAPPTPTD